VGQPKGQRQGQVGTHRFVCVCQRLLHWRTHWRLHPYPSDIPIPITIAVPVVGSNCRVLAPATRKRRGYPLGHVYGPKCCSRQQKQQPLCVGLVHSGRSQSQRRDQRQRHLAFPIVYASHHHLSFSFAQRKMLIIIFGYSWYPSIYRNVLSRYPTA